MTCCFLGGADYPCRNGTEGRLYLRGPEVITPTDDSATCKGLCTLGDLPRAWQRGGATCDDDEVNRGCDTT